MNRHFRILAWLYLAMGALSVVATCWFVYAMYFTGPWTLAPDTQRILIDAGYGTFLLWLLALVSVGMLLTGYAFLKMHRFAKSLALVFAILGIFDFPLGTMLSLYTLWVLHHAEKDLNRPTPVL